MSIVTQKTPRFTYTQDTESIRNQMEDYSKKGYSELPSAKNSGNPMILLTDHNIKSFWLISETGFNQSKELVFNKWKEEISLIN
jgi:hypothetical protein